MQKLGGFPVNSKLTVSTINVFFAGLPRVLATVHAYRYARAAMHAWSARVRVPVVLDIPVWPYMTYGHASTRVLVPVL